MGHGPIHIHRARPRAARQNHDRVVAVLRDNAASMLRIARQHSLCADDAQDAYQRALEIYLRRVERIEDATAGAWLRTVVKHEAIAIRAARQSAVATEDVDFDDYLSIEARDGEERAVSFERIARSAEALRECKDDEVLALFLRAEGSTYAEIGELTGWSYTKVNRCLAEGRARFLKAYTAIEAGEVCERWAPLLSAIVDGEATSEDLTAVRPHLRNCPGCRATLRELYESAPQLGALLPAGLALGAGSGSGAGTAARMWESLMHFVGERSAGGAVKLQAAIDAVSGGKAAAVAASAAALAGSGVAVQQAMDETRARPSADVPAAAATEPARAPEPSAVVRVAPATAAAAAPAAGRATQSSRRRRARERTRPSGDRSEFGFEVKSAPPPAPTPAPAAPAPTAAPERGASKRVASEFGFER